MRTPGNLRYFGINELPRGRAARYQNTKDVIPVKTGIQRAKELDSRSRSGMTDKGVGH